MDAIRRRYAGGAARLWAVLVISILAPLLIFLPGCGDREAEAVVTRRHIVERVRLDGHVAVPTAANANILPPYEAPVEKIYVTVGKAVKEGDVIMELSAPRTDVYYQQARQNLQQARQSLEQARQQYQASVHAAQKQLQQARQAEREARQAAQSPPDAEDEAVSISAGSELAQATARRKAAEQAVLDAKARMAEGLVPYQRRLAQAQRQFEDAQSGRKVAMIRTPISGTVLDINAEIGKTVSPDQKQPVARVVDLNALTVNAAVPERYLDEIEHNDPASIRVQQVPAVEFPGSVRQVYSEKAGFLKGASYVAVIDFKNLKGQAKPDMDATAAVDVAEVDNILAVPADAVFETDSKTAVKMRVNGEWRTRIVEIGISDGEYTQIRSGLREGDTVQANP